jgi:hypothetical protein
MDIHLGDIFVQTVVPFTMDDITDMILHVTAGKLVNMCRQQSTLGCYRNIFVQVRYFSFVYSIDIPIITIL